MPSCCEMNYSGSHFNISSSEIGPDFLHCHPCQVVPPPCSDGTLHEPAYVLHIPQSSASLVTKPHPAKMPSSTRLRSFRINVISASCGGRTTQQQWDRLTCRRFCPPKLISDASQHVPGAHNPVFSLTCGFRHMQASDGSRWPQSKRCYWAVFKRELHDLPRRLTD